MTLAAAPVYNGGNDPVVAISPSSSSPDVTAAGEYTFRVCPSDLAHGTVLAHWVRDRLHLTRGAVLYLNDEYGRGIRQTFVAEYTRLGGDLAGGRPVPGRAAGRGPLPRPPRAQCAQPEFIVVAGNRSEAEEIMRQARKRGLTMPVLGGDGLEGIQEAGALAEGVYLSSPYFPSIPSAPTVASSRRSAGNIPTPACPTSPRPATYDAIYLLRDVIARAGTSSAPPCAGRSPAWAR